MTNHFKNIKFLETDYDECNIKGVCSISPTLSAIKSAILAVLIELSFYIIRLNELGEKSPALKNYFVDVFSILITITDYREEDLSNFVVNTQSKIKEIKLLYQSFCERDNLKAKFFKPEIKLCQDFKFVDLIKQGQKYADKIKKNFSDEQQKGYELILVTLKSICLYIIELRNLNVDFEKYYEVLLSAINKRKLNEFTVEELKSCLQKYSQVNKELMSFVFEARKKEYGELIETEVSISHKEGKCILVSGSDLKELELLLEATKDKGISVYTHGSMLSSHTFPKLKAYSHLVGHYGKGTEYYMSDFSMFPGPILLTTVSLFKVESLYFSKIFTTNRVASINTRPLIDFNFEPLITSALRSEGFEETTHEPPIKIGLVEEEFNRKIYEIADTIKEGKIKNIFLIGYSNKTKAQIEYFKKFMTLIDDNNYAISFYYKNNDNSKNLFLVNTDYSFIFANKILNVLTPLKKSYDFKINILTTRCDPHIVPNLINFRSQGVDKIYFHQCSPVLINPALIDLSLEWYNIEKYTNPETDFREMTAGD